MAIRFLNGPDDPSFAPMLRIYHAAFERASREPDERLVAELRGEYRLPFRFLVSESDGIVEAFARYCRLPKSGYGFLIHIAVDEPFRGHGIGRELLTRVIQDVEPGPLLVEIDRVGPTNEWYVRQGFVPVTHEYTQPALHPDTDPVPFALYASRTPPERNRCITHFYREAWELGPDHPYVQSALAEAVAQGTVHG